MSDESPYTDSTVIGCEALILVIGGILVFLLFGIDGCNFILDTY